MCLLAQLVKSKQVGSILDCVTKWVGTFSLGNFNNWSDVFTLFPVTLVPCLLCSPSCPLKVVSAGDRPIIFSWAVRMSSGGYQWEGAGSGTVVYKTGGFILSPLRRREWRESTLNFPFLFSPPSLRPPVCPALLETCLRTSNQMWTPQRWGSDDPSPCWHQEETPRVSRGSMIRCSNYSFSLSGEGKNSQTASSLLVYLSAQQSC